VGLNEYRLKRLDLVAVIIVSVFRAQAPRRLFIKACVVHFIMPYERSSRVKRKLREERWAYILLLQGKSDPVVMIGITTLVEHHILMTSALFLVL